MRVPRPFAVLLVAVILTVPGCGRGISGSAVGDSAPPLVETTQDKAGMRAGLRDAPVQLELFTEPQCTHCADLQRDFGDQFAYFIGTGQLAITYRPLTFLDTPATDGHSGRVANALFTAAAPGNGPEERVRTTGRQFQRFVEQLWSHQQPGGAGPDDAALAELARQADVPSLQTHRIEQGADEKSQAQLADMEALNFEYLYEIDPINTGTPTVFNVGSGEKVDTYDNDWLSRLMAS